MKFLFYSDIHLAGETPRHRIDDFPKALIEKLREIYTLAEAEQCEFVTFGGDFFNSHRIFSYEVIDDAMDIVCDSKLKTYMVVGEHDLYGHSMATYKSSTMAHVTRRCGNVEILWEPLDFGDLVLYGKHEPDDIHAVMEVQVDRAKVNVLLCHELLTPKPMPFEVVDTATLTNCPYDIVLSGDLHGGFDTHKVGETIFCNPGSIARRTTSDIGRWPQVAIVDALKGAINVEIRRLECAKDGNDVFGASIAEVATQASFDVDAFTKGMLDFESESADIHELVQKAGRQAGLREEVLAYIFSKKT